MVESQGPRVAVVPVIVDEVAAGSSHALVVCGRPGTGKTQLLERGVGLALSCGRQRAASFMSCFPGMVARRAGRLDRKQIACQLSISVSTVGAARHADLLQDRRPGRADATVHALCRSAHC